MATRKILFRGQTRRKGEKTSISGIPLSGIWVAGGVFPQNKGYDYAIIYQQNPKVEKYVVHADTIGQYTGINDSLGNFIFEDDIITFWLKNDATRTRRKGVVEYSESSARFMVRVCESTDVVMLKDCCCISKSRSPNLCPHCDADLGRDCNDGYYQNPHYERCPVCGQKLKYI